MMRRITPRFLAMAGMALATLALTGPRTLAAQAADSGQTKAQVKDTTGATASQPTATSSVPRYLTNHARALHLTGKQVDRIRGVANRLDSTNAPLHAQWHQLTGGRPLRAMEPAQRRILAPQLQPIQQQLKANNATALDSVDAILTPQQQEHLQTVLQEYHRRVQARRPAQGQH
jgi:hypothetical protein